MGEITRIRARSGLRQILLLVAPAIALVCCCVLPWSEGAARVQGEYVHVQHAFTRAWQGYGSAACAAVGVLFGVLLVMVRDLSIRRRVTFLSMLFAVALIGMCASYVASFPLRDVSLARTVRNTEVYVGLGLGLHMAEAMGLAWLFAAISAWAWKKA